MASSKNTSNTILNNFVWVTIERIGYLGIQFGTMMILARILLPSDFGTIAILTIFIATSTLIVDCLGGAVINRSRVTHEDYSTLFWYNILVSIIFYWILYGISGWISDFYKNSELKSIIRILSLSFVFYAFAIVQGTQLIKECKFKKLAIISLTSQTIASIIAIILSYKGMGVWSLVWMQICQSLFNSILCFCVNHFIPALKFSLSSFKWQFSFGSFLLLSNFLQVVNLNIYSSIIGKFFPKMTGFYYQSNRIQSIPIGILSAIIDKATFPVLSRVEDQREMKEIAIYTSKYVYMFSFPLFILLIITAPSLIRIVLGQQWIEASWIFAILCIAGIPMTLRVVGRNILKSRGNTAAIFKMELINTIIGLLIISITIFISFSCMIWGFVISSIIAAYLALYYVSKTLNYSVLEQLKIAFPFLLISGICFLVLEFISGILINYNNIALLLIITSFWFVLITFLSKIFKIPEYQVIEKKIKAVFKRNDSNL